MEFDYKEIFKFSFLDLFKQKGVLKYFLFWSLFLIVLSILQSYVIYFVFGAAAKNPSISPAGIVALISYAVIFFFVFILIASIITAFFSYLLFALALSAKGKSSVKFSFLRGIKLLLLGIVASFASLFSIFKLKLLLVPVGGVLSFVIALILFMLSSKMSSSYAGGEYLFAIAVVLIGVLFVLAGVLLFFAYFVIVAYNSIRLSMSQIIFVEKEKTIMDSLKLSWGITRGKVLPIFLVMLAIGLAVGVVSSCVTIPLNVYMGSFNSVEQAPSFSKIIQLLVDPVVIVLSIPSILAQAVAIFIEIFALVSIYAFLQKPVKPLVAPKNALPRRLIKKAKK